MAASTKLEKWTVEKSGNDYTVRVPAAVRRQRNARVRIKGGPTDGSRVATPPATPARRRRSTVRLEDLIGHIKSSRKGGEIGFGPPVGKETR